MENRPLADLLRPKNLNEVAGDEKLFGENGIFQKMIDEKKIPNMILYGPSGTGKTTTADILAAASNKYLRKLNATTASLADIKDTINQTNTLDGSSGVLLYLDEIQYFNKKQQQSLLEFIEDGRITLIASTTENPYFYIYPAILSRSVVFEFKPLTENDLCKIIKRAVSKVDFKEVKITDEAVKEIARVSSGDARRALNILENAINLIDHEITPEDIRTFTPAVSGLGSFDKNGDGHYDLLSALQKSIRGSDANAAIFYLAKLLAGGDLISPCRRLLVIANEDIGLAYPQAASIVYSCVQSALQLGLPEARVPLANACVLLATSPKSNSAYKAINKAMDDIEKGLGGEQPPRHLQNTHYDGENSEIKSQNYKYPHDYPNHYVNQQYLPDKLKNKKYYEFDDNKLEQAAKAYWDKVKKGEE